MESISEKISNSFKDSPESFSFLNANMIMHTSGIFYDPEYKSVGYCVEGDEKDLRILNIDKDDIKKIHKSYLFWIDWYDRKKNKILLDSFD